MALRAFAASYLPPEWEMTPFTQIGLEWILCNQTLSPSKCALRTIEDLGFLSESLERSGIDLFERELLPAEQYPLLWNIMRAVAKVALACGIFAVISPIGFLWHGSHSLYYAALSLIHNNFDDRLRQHLRACGIDLFYIVCLASILLVAAMVSTDLGPVIDAYIQDSDLLAMLTGAFVGGLPVLFIFFLCDIAFLDSSLFFHTQAVQLRKEFGIVGKGGWLLKSNEKDFSVRNGSLDGYFYDIAHKKISYLIESLDQFSQELSPYFDPNQLDGLIGDPRLCLKELSSIYNQVPSKTEALNRAYLTAEESLKNFLSARKLIYIQPGYTFKREFLLDAEGCRDFLNSLRSAKARAEKIQQEAFASWFKRLKNDLSSDGGPSEQYRSIKKRILQATNYEEILGLQRGASEKEVNDAFKKLCRHMHPDKAPECEEEAKTIAQALGHAKGQLFPPQKKSLEEDPQP